MAIWISSQSLEDFQADPLIHLSGATELRKFGNISIQETLVTTSAYDRTLTVQTLGEGGGKSGVRPSGEEYVTAEVHPASFGGKSRGRPDL